MRKCRRGRMAGTCTSARNRVWLTSFAPAATRPRPSACAPHLPGRHHSRCCSAQTPSVSCGPSTSSRHARAPQTSPSSLQVIDRGDGLPGTPMQHQTHPPTERGVHRPRPLAGLLGDVDPCPWRFRNGCRHSSSAHTSSKRPECSTCSLPDKSDKCPGGGIYSRHCASHARGGGDDGDEAQIRTAHTKSNDVPAGHGAYSPGWSRPAISDSSRRIF